MKKKFVIIIVIAFAIILIGYVFFAMTKKPKESIINKAIKEEQTIIPEKIGLTRRPTPDFVQALYLTAYTVSNTNKFETILQRAKSSGINTIVFDIKEMEGYVSHPIKDNPNIKYLNQNILWNIDDIVKRIHSHDMVAVVRIVQFFNISSAKMHQNLLIEHKGGGYWHEKPARPTWLDPSLPAVQSDLIALIDMLGKTNVDEIQLDYVRFPTEGNLANESFYFERENAKHMHDSTYIKKEKRHVISNYLQDLDKVCKENNVRLTADIFAIVAWQHNIDIKNTGQDIAMMTPYLSQLHPMIYSSHFASNFNYRSDDFYNKPYSIVKEGLLLAKEKTAPNCLVIPYLQAFSWKVNYTKQYLFDQFRATVDSDCKGYILWNAGNNYNRTLDWVREWNNPNTYTAPTEYKDTDSNKKPIKETAPQKPDSLKHKSKLDSLKHTDEDQSQQ